MPDENVGEENTPQQNTITDVTGDSTHAGTSDADIFVFTADNGDDTITGFANGVDHIDLSAFPEIRSFDDLTITSSDDGVTIDLTEHGGGDDSIRGGEGRDSLLGDAGDDTIFGDAGNDWIVGGAGDDELYGGADNDKLVAGSGTDELFGGAGADSLNGGLGDDTLTGGADADTFYFNGAFGTDTITDFTDGEDAIDLTAMTGITGFEDLTISADGTDAVIDLTSQGGGTIRLEGFDVNDLDADDFNFYDSSTQESEIEGI